jgi:hypothetical protein
MAHAVVAREHAKPRVPHPKNDDVRAIALLTKSRNVVRSQPVVVVQEPGPRSTDTLDCSFAHMTWMAELFDQEYPDPRIV